MQPRIVILDGSVEERVIPLVDLEISFGRDPSNIVHFNDNSVSRYHCCIKPTSGGFRIYDLQSLNGTFINDVAFPERALNHGDRIRIGKSELLFLHKGSESPQERVMESQAPTELATSRSGETITIRVPFRSFDRR